MQSIVAGTLVAAAVLFATSSAVAQRDRDAADRGQRLESGAFRNDMLQNQQRKPAYQRSWQDAPAPVEEKPKRSQRKRKSD